MDTVRESNIRITIANNIIKLMELQKKSRRQVCEDLDIKYTTFCDWVNAKTSPKPEALEILGYYFGVGIQDFFVEINRDSVSSERIVKYAEKINDMKELSLGVLEKMSDDDIRVLLNAGYRFKHKTLEERIAESGGKIEPAKDLLSEFQPVGREIW